MITRADKQRMKDAWSNLDSDKLRRVYWRLNKDFNHKNWKHFMDEIEIFKMETFKEILIQRLEW